ncbi:anaphase-promoting complex subunit 2 isoform X2 [Amborella trichopoda]|uniref:anaphase-promoting complex subunit 2 isoform X2 n=1 Tax=Amborella trichopoda TaxID=13333 RepID=UPI0009C0B0BE|nr:anaphase-promoting complex subunit 2 isoform X2 [Amborella trichopoda]|eukprot:XP_020521064.1 anaphase-promoting complex subunit 2 isoform X2 [Amborella trichopoda]
MAGRASSHDQRLLPTMDRDAINEITHNWSGFCIVTEKLLQDKNDPFKESEFVAFVSALSKHGLSSLVQDYFLQALEETFRTNSVAKFWRHFDAYSDFVVRETNVATDDWVREALHESLEEISSEKLFQEKCLSFLLRALQAPQGSKGRQAKASDSKSTTVDLLSRYHLMVASILLTMLPRYFPEILRLYFKERLEELSLVMSEQNEDGDKLLFPDKNRTESNYKHFYSAIDEMDHESHHETVLFESKLVGKAWISKVGKVVQDLRSLGFISMTEDAYSCAIFLLLKRKVEILAGDDYRTPVLDSIKEWIQAVPLQFLSALLSYLGDSIGHEKGSSGYISPLASCPPLDFGQESPSEGLIRWKLRLEYFAYETLQDLRIDKLFEIIVDYPDSCPAIEDLKHCLENTGQHSKLVDSFISALRYRLLTAGASTNDILHQYVSTIKALRTIDPTGVFLEAVGEPIRDYLRGRKDTIKCLVTMLTDGSGGNSSGPGSTGDSLLEELIRDAGEQETSIYDDEFDSEDKQAWSTAQSWEPDPIDADPLKGSRNRRKIDILGMIVNIIGSKDQLVNEYRVMLAEKLLNKSDYEIDSEIRTLELLKIHFGESSMQRCEIMLNDLIDSKRTNANIKASLTQLSQKGIDQGDNELLLDHLDATIISSNFWPPFQAESVNIPAAMDKLLDDYAKRFHEIKTPRKLLWKKNLGTVKVKKLKHV